MDINKAKCFECSHSYMEDSIKCDLNPHDYKITIQKQIVRWLCEGQWGICPGFEHYKERQNNAGS